MNTTELKTFISVAEHASVSSAAEELHLTQPAITKRIQGLEQKLGTALFDRIGKRLHLTQAGRLLQHQATEILARWSDTERQLHALTDEVTGTLALATSGGAAVLQRPELGHLNVGAAGPERASWPPGVRIVDGVGADVG